MDQTPDSGLKLVAGELCLDFANTVAWHASARPTELLKSYQGLVAWSVQVGALGRVQARRLLRAAGSHPAAAAAVFRRAVTIREAIYRITVAGVKRQAPAASDLDTFNRELKSALAHLRVIPTADGFGWEWEDATRALAGVLWPILRSAADLLTSERRQKVGQCADDRGCGWLFFDTTRNGSRRWCEMGDCGNRAKARRHYQRRRRRLPRRGRKS